MDVSCATSANPLNIYNNLRARYHPHHPEEASQHRLLSQQHHQQQLGPYDDDATSSGGHSEAVMWEKYRQQPHNDNDKPPFYMVQDDLITPSSSHYPRHQSSYFYADTRMPSTASLSLIYNTNNQPLASTNTRDFLETVESPLFIDRHQQTNVTTNKESLKQNSNRVSSSIKTEKDGMQREQNLLNEFDDNESRNATTIEDSPPKKKDKKDKKANVTSKQYSNDNSNTNRKSPIVAERKKQRRESHNAVERRRRNNINDNIRLLGELLPENICQGKQNKGSILKGSVLYIRMLNDQLLRYKERVERLEYETVALQSVSQ